MEFEGGDLAENGNDDEEANFEAEKPNAFVQQQPQQETTLDGWKKNILQKQITGMELVDVYCI